MKSIYKKKHIEKKNIKIAFLWLFKYKVVAKTQHCPITCDACIVHVPPPNMCEVANAEYIDKEVHGEV